MRNEELYNNTKKFAKLRGLSLQDVATRAGLSVNSLYMWSQRGTARPSTIRAVATVLGVKPEQLTGSSADGTAGQPARQIDLAALLQDESTKLLYNGRQLDQRDRDTVGRVLDR
ncbi:helix-turn-helix domain-containing protein [Lacticaseibacillus rhamnosus]|uniref:helix-turn-helix domain-containing protein n=1 Tax=Lacticaseibacillus rhamnosus TaxID=47715 RepID=UPI00237F761B|nr:helix-turn-helix transcriptional regulator [Lacticaseibacillus rhamnosus]MDE3295899.1 helix-turn-helix transcriptional regulator [Lacticaseibacillus rhamnosus]